MLSVSTNITLFVRWRAATIVENETAVNSRPFDDIFTLRLAVGEEAAGLVVAMPLETTRRHQPPITALVVKMYQ